MVPLSFPIDELVSKCLCKSSKAKKEKIESKIYFDKDTEHWLAKIAKPPQEKFEEDITPQDYQVSKVHLGKGSREVDMMIFEVSNKKNYRSSMEGCQR